MISETPSIYNVPGVYNTGAAGGGGGGGEFIDVDGKQVKIKDINGIIWTCENISVLNIPGVVYNGSGSNDPRAFWYKKEIRNSGYGLLWNLAGAKKCLDYLTDLKNDGWRIPTKADFENLVHYYNDDAKYLKNQFAWPVDWNGTNESEFSCIPGGRYDGSNFQSYGGESFLVCSTQQNTSTYYALSFSGSTDTYSLASWYLNQCFNLRLCKDA